MSQAGNFGGGGTVPGDGMPPIPPGATVMDTPYAAPPPAAMAPVGAGSAAAMQPPSPYGGYGGAPPPPPPGQYGGAPPPPPPGPYGYGPPPPQGGRGGGSQTIIMAILGVLAVGGIGTAIYLGVKKEDPAPAPPPQAAPAGTTVINIPGLPSGMALPSGLPVFVPPGQTTTPPPQQVQPKAQPTTATTTTAGAGGATQATIPVQGATAQPTATTAPTTAPTTVPTTAPTGGARPPKITTR